MVTCSQFLNVSNFGAWYPSAVRCRLYQNGKPASQARGCSYLVLQWPGKWRYSKRTLRSLLMANRLWNKVSWSLEFPPGMSGWPKGSLKTGIRQRTLYPRKRFHTVWVTGQAILQERSGERQWQVGPHLEQAWLGMNNHVYVRTTEMAWAGFARSLCLSQRGDIPFLLFTMNWTFQLAYWGCVAEPGLLGHWLWS